MAQGKARIWQEDLVIPTYELGEEERLPIFYKLRINQGTKGDIYPYKNKDILTLEMNENHVYKALRMENDYIRVTVLPELGGRIYEGYDKVNDYNFVYKNNVIKPALIGMNGAWISGGIEFNWPQHHRPTTFLPVESTIEEEADGSVTAWVGETESRNGQKCLMGVNIHPDRSYITSKVKLYNPTAQKEAFHWWANLAVHVNDSYRLMFPPDIDYITFHDKTHVSPFPIVKNEFAGADYGEEGVDIRYVKNLKPAASFFIFDSDYSFMAGYDDSVDMGTVHVADKFLSPGKKFFTWGRAGYGEAWQKNLTDTDGDYIEIMTGCFTDNQPDFTWIMPYETKTFEQHWYSVKGVKDLKNANNEGAIGVYKDEEGVAVSFNVTSPGKVTLNVNGASWDYDAVPGQVYTVHAEQVAEVNDAKVTLFDENGIELVAWEKIPMFFEDKEVPKKREKPARPEDIETIDELWVNGMHIEQYKHAVIKPEIFYLEGLKRDPGDIRCNVAMGVLMYRKGDFEKAAHYLEAAVKRATSRNPNPIDAECYYQLGLAYRQMGELKKALAAFKRSAWTYAWKSAALQQSAEIENLFGDMNTALLDLDASLETNAHSLRGLAQRSALWIRKGKADAAKAVAENILAYDPLDASSLFTLYLCGDEAAGAKITEILGHKTVAYLNLAEVYLPAGLYEEGKKALELCPNKTAMLYFYLGWTADKMGDCEACDAYLEQGETAPQEGVFPNTVFDFGVLDFVSGKGKSALAPYYMGCMYCGRDNDKTAAVCWQLAVMRNPGFADAHRTLAQALFECYNDSATAKAEMEEALKCSREPRIFFEYYQLIKVLGASDDELLALLESNMDLVEKRQDLILQYIERLCRVHRLDEADKLFETAKFYSYEGGEGHVPAVNAFANILRGEDALAAGDNEKALEYFIKADTFPEQFHEGARFQECRAQYNYFKAIGYEAVGDKCAAEAELKAAVAHKDNAAESQYFKGLALRKLGKFVEAGELFEALKKQAEGMLASHTLQFFLGFPAAQPFEQSERRTIEKMGYTALFYAQLGLGEYVEAEQTAQLMRRKGMATYWVEHQYKKIVK